MSDVTSPMHKSGIVSIVGRPNVGKSTLLNKILGEKVSIVSKVPQTTRQKIRGIYTDERGQIIFVDTPGLHVGRDKLDKYMNQNAAGAVEEADCVVYVVDTTRHVGMEEEKICSKVLEMTCPVIVALNKVDLQKDGALMPEYISFIEDKAGKSIQDMKNFILLPISAETGTNTDKLLDLIFERLKEGPALYPQDVLTDHPQRIAIADVIREKLFNIMREEIPHSLGVMIEHMEPKRHKTMHIKALIIVERETQKQIVIGKNGSLLKEAATQARLELEDLLDSKVYLECFVKVEPNWRDKIDVLQDLGYESF